MRDWYEAFKISWGMMTNIPLFHSFSLKTNLSGKSVAFYPLIGLILGLMIWGTSIPLSYLFPENLLPFLLFGIYTLSYGALHTDGLADTLDALLSYKKPEEAAKILKDPHIGAQGAVYLIIFILIKAVTFAEVSPFDFVAIPMLSRFGVLIGMYRFPYIKTGTMARSQHKQFTKKDLIFASFTLLLIFPFMQLRGLFLLPISILVTYICAKWISKRLTGLNGDSYGFIIEMNELVLLLVTVKALR